MIHAVVSGRLGGDSELSQVGDNKVLNFQVAADHGFGDKKTTTWLRAAVWGKRGESLAALLKKGQQVVLRGEVWTEEYTDQKTGKEKVRVQCRADEVELVGGKPSGGGTSPSPSPSKGGKPDDDVPF